jgi:hypothetical protein
MKDSLTNALTSAFKSMTKDEQEKFAIAYMKNPKQALDYLWQELKSGK